MFKVECPGCKAPYQVDERRVPSTGLKMRCPKCGTSFQVDPPLDPRATGPSPVLGGGMAPMAPAPAAPAPGAKPGLPPGRKATMLGVAAPSAGGVVAKPQPKATLLGAAVPGGAPKPPMPPRPAGAKPMPPPRPAPAADAEDDLDADLPAPVAPKPKAGAEPDFADFGDIGLDLPAPAAAPAPPARPAAPKPPPRPAPAAAPAQPAADEFDLDLPAPVVAGAAPTAGFGEIDLPAPVGAAPAAPAADAEELDLPVVGAPRGAPGMADLPSPARGGGGFDVDLPAPTGGAAAPSGGLFGELDLPSVSAELPAISADLPVAGQAPGLPVAAAGLPAPAAGLPSAASDLPTAADFLPQAQVSSGFPEGPAPFDPSVGHLGTVAGAAAGAAAGAVAGAAAGFGEVDLGAAPSAPPAGQPAWGQAPAPQELVRQGGGGTAFGEVNLDGGEGGAPIAAGAEDMEFGGLPQQGDLGAIGVDDAGALPRVGEFPAEDAEGPQKKRSLRAIAAVVVVLALGGGALALVPSIGPFGVVWVYDKVKAGEYQRLLATTANNAREALAKDTFPEARNAYQQVERARTQAKRVRGLVAYQVYVAHARELRFGADPEAGARAQVLLAELKEFKPKEIPNLALARAAAKAASGEAEGARAALADLAKTSPNDIDVLTLQGELELRVGDAAAAGEIWTKAEEIEKSARAAFGLARARLAAGERKEAEELARKALERSPAHAGARTLIARATWNHGKEADALELLGEVTGSAATASPSELVDAYTLAGDIHLARSRVTHADQSYSEALKIDPKAAQPLVGLGDALFRAGRYSEALARFEAGVQADPKEVTAKVGVAKATLALERIQDATAAIGKLREEYKDNVLVAYWYGKVQEAVGNRKEAEAVFQAAIKASPKDPNITLIYVGLAQLLNSLGRNDEAEKVLADARASQPKSAGIHVAIGELALLQGKLDAATDELQKALKLDPGDVGAKFQLGVTHRRARRFDEATKLFDEVAKVDKEYPGLALERGLLYEQSGRTAEALKAYESALAKAPNDPDLMLRVGCGKAAEAQAKEAIVLLRKVLDKRPTSAEGNHCLGRALLVQGSNMAEALKALERAVDFDPNRAEYYLYVGWAANESARASRAESALAKALELDRNMGDAYWQRGVLRYRQGAVRDAVKDLQKALELKPSRVEAHAALADSFYDLGKEAEALREYQLAVEARPDEANWRFRYGRLLAANRRAGDAERELVKALELATKADVKPRWLWEAHHLLARSMGERKEAIEHWEEFLKLGPSDSPYRAEAKKKLAELGKPWEGN